MVAAMSSIRLQREPFDASAEIAALRVGRTDIGAVVTFTGICRGEENGAPIAALTLEHYPEMAEAEIGRQVDAALARWSLKAVRVIHRFGRIVPGEDIVLVITASSHRQDAFAAAEFLMDYLKTRAPFWKEVEQSGRKSWIDAKATDESATARWEQAKTLPPPFTGQGRGGGRGGDADRKAGRRRT
jgi:molybdopterin synthase catalytic subunit